MLSVKFAVESSVGLMLVVSMAGLFVICVIVEAGDMCTDCEEVWQTEEDNNCTHKLKSQTQNAR